MSHLPDRLLSHRMKIQMDSIESPSEFISKKINLTSSDSASRKTFQEKLFNKKHLHLDFCDSSPVTLTKYSVKSPMSDLAHNLGETSINTGNTPSPGFNFIKKALDMDIESSPSPSSSHGHSSDSSTPLSSITNKPKGRAMGGRSLTRCNTAPHFSYNESNKENIPLPFHSRSSPMKSPSKPCDSPLSLKDRKSQFQKLVQSPESFKSNDNKTLPLKRPRFKVLEDDDSSRDSGYASQPLEESRMRKKSRQEPETTSMKDILENCSPSKNEEGLSLLSHSPASKSQLSQSPASKSSSHSTSDGFDLDSLDVLEDIPEDDEESQPTSSTFSSLLDRKILMQENEFRPRASSNNVSPVKSSRNFRRALSMMDTAPSCLNSDSPVSRSSNFKRPEPPMPALHASNCLAKKKKHNAMVERSVSLQHHDNDFARPLLQRSQSEMTISSGESTKESCELMESNPDMLPDAHGTYSLPSEAGMCRRHPNLRSITCDTLADLIAGKYLDTVNSFRIIDVRYKFEYEGGHIEGAENWQHGEDEEFLSAILPTEPLAQKPEATPLNQNKRDIVIFHCEFSSQRAPDFHTKLRERDRALNWAVYPGLHYPECYLLHKGYKEFFLNYPDLCTGKYTEMADPCFKEELRVMRAKSKSWAGGTVSRTGTLSRKCLK